MVRMPLSLPLALLLATPLLADEPTIITINGVANYVYPNAGYVDSYTNPYRLNYNFVTPAPRTDSPLYQPYGYSPYYSHQQIGGPPPVHYHSYGYYHPHNVTAIKITVKK